ncbi:hypothetical protein LT40_18035 [Pseudomonas rhizosphaerae]|uniref:Uncharacterized protein n=1 Tax=Pseudomonas rhizosphaerae TaxID=216142 RepID=A0A089YU91_9PSED|nr:hypothetical protein LT40_18035 [Pseudomonas rhizosphaerae]
MVIVQNDLPLEGKLSRQHIKSDQPIRYIIFPQGVRGDGSVIHVEVEIIIFKHGELQHHLYRDGVQRVM